MKVEVKEVDYYHWRVSRRASKRGRDYLKKGKPPSNYLYSRHMLNGEEILPTGGKTRCFLYLGAGINIVGQATCSMSDNFCYKTGREIAYGRAMKKLKEMEANGNNK